MPVPTPPPGGDDAVKAPESKKNFVPKINFVWCKRCGICISVCPRHILGFDDDNKLVVTDSEKCIGCGMCENICPDFAIEIYDETPQPADSGPADEEGK